MLEINVKSKVAMKRCYHSIDLLLIFQKYLVICNEFNEAFNSIYLKNIDFLIKGQLNGEKNG